jgi:hypothetical protein
MRLLVLQDHLRSGGTERQSILLANAFAAAGHAATLLTFRPGGALAGTVSPAVERASLQPRDLGLDWFAPGLRRQVRARRPDLILLMGRMANCLGWSLTPLAPMSTTAAPSPTATREPASHGLLARLRRRPLAAAH